MSRQAGLGGHIKNTIGRLDQVRRFKFTQEVAAADKVDAFRRRSPADA
jgi:hypothetical protein